MVARDRSRMKEDSTGRVQVTLSLERIIPFGQRQTAEGLDTAGAPNLDLVLTAGARRQRWEQCSGSQGLEEVDCWERACISWRERRHRHR